MSLELRCPRHPKFDGLLPPRAQCQDCWELFRLKHENQGALFPGSQ